MSSQGPSVDVAPQYCSLTRKVRIKNAKRIKNVTKTRNRYQQAKFAGSGQRPKNSRTCNSSQASQLDGERIKVRKKARELSAVKYRNEDSQDQASDASSISEVSTVGSDVSNRKTPSLVNKYLFKSKRLQELQEKKDSETTADVAMEDETTSGEIRRNSKDEKTDGSEVCGDSENERSSLPRSRRQSLEQRENHVDEEHDSKRPAAVKKKRVSAKKTSLSTVQAVKNDDEMPSSSEDEESCKPLSQVKNDIKKEQQNEKQEPTERVVKKVIKVVKKIRTKSGETKTKVVKIIKKIGVRKKGKDTTPLVPGRRRSRCGNCRGCKITSDCGECRWCK